MALVTAASAAYGEASDLIGRVSRDPGNALKTALVIIIVLVVIGLLIYWALKRFWDFKIDLFKGFTSWKTDIIKSAGEALTKATATVGQSAIDAAASAGKVITLTSVGSASGLSSAIARTIGVTASENVAKKAAPLSTKAGNLVTLQTAKETGAPKQTETKTTSPYVPTVEEEKAILRSLR
jgi:hypothetical protein